MPMNLAEQLEQVARRANQRRLLTAAFLAFAAVFLTAMALVGIDWLLGLHQRPPRIALTATLVVALGAIFRRAVERTRLKTSPLDVALAFERQNPKYQSLLASALEFSRQENDDPTAGYVDLRRAVVLRAALAADELDLEQVVPQQPLRHAALAACSALVLLAAVIAVVPETLTIGFPRLVNPLSNVQWPRQHELEFAAAPTLIPIGSDFHAELRDRRGQLPASITVQFRTRSNGYWQTESQTYAAGGESLVIARPNVQQSFQYRARGGDDRAMPWQKVEAAPAPRIESLKLVVHPPAYTGRPVEELSEPWQVIAGSSLELHGTTNEPITAAELQAVGEPAVRLQIGESGSEFHVALNEWRPAKTAVWSLVFTTPQGLHAPAERRLSIQVQPDRPPTAEIISPTEEAIVVPEARLALSLAADDDLAVKTIRLLLVSEQTPDAQPRSIEVFHGPAQAEPGRRELSYLLDISGFASKPGTSWSLRAQAEDYLGQTSDSPRPLRVRVVTRNELVKRFDELTARLAATLERALAAQQKAAESVAAWQRDDSHAPGNDEIAQVAAHQRVVAELISAGPASASELAQMLATEYERNKWNDQAARMQIQQTQAVLAGLAANELPAIDGRLATLARDLQAAPAERAQRTAAIHDPQQAVAAALGSLLRDLSQSKEVQEHQRELADLKQDQAALRQKTEEAARNSLTHSAGKPATEEEQTAKQLAAEQRELAGRLSAAAARLRASAESLASAKPNQAARLSDAARALEQSPAQAALHQAAEDLAARRFGQAVSNQRAAEQQLDELIRRLAAGRQNTPPGQRLAELQQAEKRLEVLRKENDQLAAAQEADAKANQAGAQLLAEKTQQLADRLEQLRAAAAAKAASQASSALQNGKDAAAAAKQAQSDFQKAQQELQAERRREKAEESKRLIEELNLALARLVSDQQMIAQDAASLATRQPTAEQPATAKSVADRQLAVRETTTKEADAIEQLPVFARMLRMAATTMKTAEADFTSPDKFSDAAKLAEQAHGQLKQLADAVNLQARQQAQPPRSPAAGDKQNNGAKPPQDKSAQIQALQLAVSQLSLLRTMQEGLKQATAELESNGASAADKKLAQEQREQLKDLAGEQQDLSELAKSLMEEIELPTEDDIVDPRDESKPEDAPSGSAP